MENSIITLPNEIQIKNGNIISFFYKKIKNCKNISNITPLIKEKEYIAYYSLKENESNRPVEGYGKTLEEALLNLKIALNYFVSKQL